MLLRPAVLLVLMAACANGEAEVEDSPPAATPETAEGALTPLPTDAALEVASYTYHAAPLQIIVAIRLLPDPGPYAEVSLALVDAGTGAAVVAFRREGESASGPCPSSAGNGDAILFVARPAAEAFLHDRHEFEITVARNGEQTAFRKPVPSIRCSVTE
jgi:hypothetical protein